MEWWPIVKSTYDYQVEWSPQGGIIRAKLRKAEKWRHGRSEKAQWAEPIGLSLIQERRGDGNKTQV